ncbi:MAG: adenosylhomocysteine nucleosidase [Solirubrobacteraceae bacterium]
MSEHKVDILILTALRRELEAVRANSGPWRRERDHDTDLAYYSTNAYHGLSIAATGMAGMGPLDAAMTTAAALTALRPKRLLLVGICAGIASHIRLGDVCVSDQVVDYDVGKVRDGAYEPRWRAFPADAQLVREARHFSGSSWADTILASRPDGTRDSPSVHIGTVLSGSKIVADSGFVDALRSVWTQAVGLEMEGAASAAAAHQHSSRPSFILIKGVCDHATAEKNDQWQDYAAEAAARYAISLLIDCGGAEPLRHSVAPRRGLAAEEPALSGLTRADMLAMLTTAFDLRELQRLCFELDLDWEDVADRETKSGAAMSILGLFGRHGDLPRLLGYVKDKRPGLFAP